MLPSEAPHPIAWTGARWPLSSDTGFPGLLISNTCTSGESAWNVERKCGSVGLKEMRSNGDDAGRLVDEGGDTAAVSGLGAGAS